MMEKSKSKLKSEPGRIIRTSIFTFLQNYQRFTFVPSLLAFPYAAAILLSQSLVESLPLFWLIRARLVSIFLAAGFPSSSRVLGFLAIKLSQTVLTSLLVSPFTLAFLLVAKASVITVLSRGRSSVSYQISLFNALFVTQLCNMLVIVAANATCFFVVALLFNFLDILGISVSGPILIFLAIVYAIILANAYVICNLALVLSGIENHGGFISILKASVMIQGRTATALTLAAAVNTVLIGVEALFQYRVVRTYHLSAAPGSTILLEGIFIAYLYALLLVLDTVIGCVFWKSCKNEHKLDDHKDMHRHGIEIVETNKSCAGTEVNVHTV